jgi:hypothetical protein
MSRMATLPDAIRVVRFDRGSVEPMDVDEPAFLDVSSARAIWRKDSLVVVELSFATYHFVMADAEEAARGVKILVGIAAGR